MASGDEAATVVANDPNDLKGELKRIGGSQSDHWNKNVDRCVDETHSWRQR